jgi:hypothetical protein
MAKMTVMGPTHGHAGRVATKAAGKTLGMLMEHNKRPGDHILLDQDMKAGQYTIAWGQDANGMVTLEFTPGVVA